MKLKRKDGITYLLIKGHVSALMEWPVFLFMIRRYVLYVRLDNWLWVPAKGRNHAMIDWDHWIYGKWWAFLCFQVYRTEPVPPAEVWSDISNPITTFMRVGEPGEDPLQYIGHVDDIQICQHDFDTAFKCRKCGLIKETQL